jgi:bacterioferritin (cytochrome b1)
VGWAICNRQRSRNGHLIGTDDPTTCKMLEGILAQEEEHAEDLASLLKKPGS